MIIDSEYLKSEELTRQLEECECTLAGQIQKAEWDALVIVAPPPAYRIMLVKMKKRGKTTLREAVKVQDFLARQLKDHGLVCLVGLANNSLVFYLFEGSILGPAIERTHGENDKVRALGVEEITFAKHVRLDAESGGLTLHPDVSICEGRQ